ncbi:MAG: electron transport complex subunit RsxA [Bacillota bacterium]|jgi:electron transport complex protein RnfA
MGQVFAIVLGGILVNNFVLSRFLGICPFLGVSKKVETATGMGIAVTFVMTVASAVTWLIQTAILENFDLLYLQTIAFILVIAALVQLVEMFLQKSSPTLYQALGVYLPLITTNCAVLGVAILNINTEYGLLESMLNGFSGGLGFFLAIVIFAGIRERLAASKVAKPLQGFPLALITAGLLSIAFLGFQGLL